MSLTITDERAEDITELLLACHDLLALSRFHYWLRADDKEDDSNLDVMARAEKALERMKVPQVSLERFVQRLEVLLKSGLTPEEFRKQEDAGTAGEQLLWGDR